MRATTYTTGEAARKLHVTIRQITYLVRDKGVVTTRKSGGRWVLTEVDVKELRSYMGKRAREVQENKRRRAKRG